MGDENPILRIEQLVSGYGEMLVLKGVSFDIKPRQTVCIIGANGAGKSTLLRTIFGLLQPQEGHVYFEGTDIAGFHPVEVLKRGISYVMQGRGNLPAMSVQDNLEMAAYIRHDQDVKHDIKMLMDRFPVLGKKRQEFAGNLSGGEQQILEMSMALMLHPKVILLDEPSLGLSPIMSDLVFDAIRQLNADGTTIVLVEQNAKRALSISDKGVVLELGKIRQEGRGKDLLEDEELRRNYLGE